MMGDRGRPGYSKIHPIVHQMGPSPEQLPGILSRGQDVVVTAGAGTGKTRTLVARFLALLAEGLPSRAVVAITFTNKAAREMRNRVREEIRRYMNRPELDDDEQAKWQQSYRELDAARIGTIHSLCSEILRAHPAEAGVDPLFEVLDEGRANLLRGEAVRDTMAWAADTESVVDLFAILGEWGLAETLDNLLRRRLEACEVFERLPPDLMGEWKRVLGGRQEALLAEMTSEEAWKNAIKTLLQRSALRPHDRMEIARRQVLEAVDGAKGAITQRLESLGRLDEISLVGGSQAAWPGGADERDEVKEAVRTLREMWRSRADVLGLQLSALDEQLAMSIPALESAFRHGLMRYEELKAAENMLDFDDLEHLALDLLANNCDVRGRWQDEVASLLVDEFQDTNGRQRNLVRLLNGARGRLFIVGDAKQSIYRFRGADVTVFREERREAERGDGVVLSLATSYRAHRDLLAGLNGILAPALGEEVDESRPWVEPFSPLAAHRQAARPGFEGPHIELHLTVGTKREGALERAAEMVVGRLVALVEGGGGDPDDEVGEPPDYGDIAILCRAGAAFRVYEDALDRAGVPFLTVAGRGFYQRPEIRDLLNALRALSDPTDDLALVGLLRSSAIGISDVTLYSLCRGRDRSLWEIIRDGERSLENDQAWRIERAVRIIRELNQRVGRIPVSHLLKGYLDRTDYRAALIRAGETRSARNVSKLLSDAQQSGIVSTSEFLEYIDRLRGSGTREGEARAAAEGAVQIMSIHAAKGLEFPVVVIGDVTGIGGGSSPLLIDPELGVVLPLSEGDETAAAYRLAKSRSDDQAAAESNRLLYVAATRAQEKLILNGSVTRRQDGSLSRFGPWLDAISSVDGVDLGEMELAYDEQGRVAKQFDWMVAGQQVRCVIYEPGHEGMRRKAQPISHAEELSAWPPKLLGPVIPKGRSFDETVRDRERPLWRVVPGERESVTPRVVGLLVHEALAAWQFPGPEFHDSVKARAHRYGVHDSRQLLATVDRVTELMKRLRDHALYDEMAGAERRLHEVPYCLKTNGEVESGVIDLLYRRAGRWTAVEFKTSRVSARGGAWGAMDDGALRIQVERYKGAAEILLGEIPRFLVCLLDFGGRVEVVPV